MGPSGDWRCDWDMADTLMPEGRQGGGASKFWRTTFLCVGVLLLGACGQPDSAQVDAESPWKAYIDAQREYLTDYEWEILKDYEVTDAELRDAKDKSAACMADKGFEDNYFPFWPYGSREVMPTDVSEAEFDRQLDACVLGTLHRVEMFHREMRMNPNNEDIAELILGCLREHDLIDQSVTAEDLFDPQSLNSPDAAVMMSEDWRRCEFNPIGDPFLDETFDNFDNIFNE